MKILQLHNRALITTNYFNQLLFKRNVSRHFNRCSTLTKRCILKEKESKQQFSLWDVLDFSTLPFLVSCSTIQLLFIYYEWRPWLHDLLLFVTCNNTWYWLFGNKGSLSSRFLSRFPGTLFRELQYYNPFFIETHLMVFKISLVAAIRVVKIVEMYVFFQLHSPNVFKNTKNTRMYKFSYFVWFIMILKTRE